MGHRVRSQKPGVSGQPFDKLRTGRQEAEIRGQRSGVKLISDLRLLTSVIGDF